MDLAKSSFENFVQRQADQLTLHGERFRMVGGNIYYLAFSTEDEQNRMLDIAGTFGFNVLRIWAFNDFGSVPGDDDVCFQVLAPGMEAPSLREGPGGLERLDRAVKLAGQRGIRLILTLTNHNPDYGGMPLFQKWLGLGELNDCYRDPRAKTTFQNWIAALLSRTNRLTGIPYAEDPAILAWEIANEPRCPSPDADSSLLTGWIAEMSRFIKSLAPQQLVSAGDEGFFHHQRAGSNWFFNGSCGVSAEEILGIPEIDFGTYHMYPDIWAKGENLADWGAMWIQNHIDAARRASKPVLLEEYGLPESAERNGIYADWLAMVEEQDAAGDLVWMVGLPGKGDRYLLSEVRQAPAIAEHAARMLGGKPAVSAGWI